MLPVFVISFHNLKRYLAPMLGLVLVACDTTGPQDSENFIFLNESEPLFVDFDISVNPALDLNMPEVADRMEESRHEDFMHVMQELLYQFRLPVDVHLLGQHERPGTGPVLDVYAVRFEQDSTGDLTVTLVVKLHKYGELNTLGVYKNRASPPIALNESQLDKAFRDTIRGPLQAMLGDLLLHFETEEDRKMVEAPLLGLE